MKKMIRSIEASLIPKKQQALDTLSLVRSVYESDTSGLLTGKVYNEFMAELDVQIQDVKNQAEQGLSYEEIY